MTKNWIEWDFLPPPQDVKGILIKFDDGKIWTDAHFYASAEYKNKTVRNSRPIEWTFMDRRNNERSIKCIDQEEMEMMACRTKN